MINAVLIDDEKAGISNLAALLTKYCPQIKIAGTASNIEQGKQLIEEHKAELVFLDIEMPYGNGFDLLASYDKLLFEVIFVTAFDKYVLRAIRLSACDYIMKPIEITELVTAVNKAAEQIKSKKENSQLKNLVDNMRGLDKDRKIALPTLYGMIFIKVSDIIRCEADGGYTWFYFTTRDKLLVTKNLGEYDTVLNNREFIRIHHAHLVNTRHIIEFRKGNAATVIMSDNSSIPVSSRKRDMLLEYLHNTVV